MGLSGEHILQQFHWCGLFYSHHDSNVLENIKLHKRIQNGVMVTGMAKKFEKCCQIFTWTVYSTGTILTSGFISSDNSFKACHKEGHLWSVKMLKKQQQQKTFCQEKV